MSTLSNVKQIILQNKKINNVDVVETAVPTRYDTETEGEYIYSKEMKKDVLLTEKSLLMSYDVSEDYKITADEVSTGSTIKIDSIIKAGSKLTGETSGAIKVDNVLTADWTVTGANYVVLSTDVILPDSTLAAGSTVAGTIEGKEYSNPDYYTVPTGKTYTIQKDYFALTDANKLVTVQSLEPLVKQQGSKVEDTLIYGPRYTTNPADNYEYGTGDYDYDDDGKTIINIRNAIQDEIVDKYVTTDSMQQAYITKVYNNPKFISNNKGKLMTLSAALDLTTKPELIDLILNNSYYAKSVKEITGTLSAVPAGMFNTVVEENYDESTQTLKYIVKFYDGNKLIGTRNSDVAVTSADVTAGSITVVSGNNYQVVDLTYGFYFDVIDATATLTLNINGAAAGDPISTYPIYVAVPVNEADTALTTNMNAYNLVEKSILAKYVDFNDKKYYINYGTLNAFNFSVSDIKKSNALIIGNDVIISTTSTTITGFVDNSFIVENASYDATRYALSGTDASVTVTAA